MNTQEYLAQVRATTGYTDYRIGKELGIQQTNISKYNLGKQTLSETHAFQFSEILNIPVGKIIADTKLENAIIKNNAKKISFWKKQVKNLKSGLAGAFVFAFLALSPVDELHAQEESDNHNKKVAIIYIM